MSDGFVPTNFWESLYNRQLEQRELDEIQSNATAFVSTLMEARLLEEKRKLLVEIYRIDHELENLAKNILPHLAPNEIIEKFDVASAFMLKNKISC